MSKRGYTHAQILLPEIQKMVAAGKSQREIAEYFGFKDKYVELLKRERRKAAKIEVGIMPRSPRTTSQRCRTKRCCIRASV